MEQLPRRGGPQRRGFDHRRDLAPQREGGKLMRQLKAPTLGGLRRVDHEVPHRRVEIAQRLRLTIDDRNPERIAKPSLDRFDRGRRILAAQLPGQHLGSAVDAVDIIAGIVKPVAHFLPRQAASLGGAAGQRFVDDLEPLPCAAIGGVERDELIGKLWLLQRRTFELFGGQGRGSEQRIGGGFAQCAARRSPASAATSSHSSGNKRCRRSRRAGVSGRSSCSIWLR